MADKKKTFKPGAVLSPVPAVMVSCGDGSIKNIITIADIHMILSSRAANL